MQELILKLNAIVLAGTKKSDLEESIGLPENSLSAVLSGKKEMPNSWVPKIESFLTAPIVENPIPLSPDAPKVKMVVNRKGGLEFKPSDEKMKMLAQTMEKINKDFGAGSVMCLGDGALKGVEAISTGSIGLDAALGIGGLPKGRIVEIYGPESSGKTTLALHVIAEAQKKGGICAFIDAEHAFDETYAKNIGVDTDKLRLSQPDYGEQALEEADRLIGSGAISVIVIDSVAALVPKAELEGEMGDAKMALQARLMSQACRKLTGTVSRTGTLLIFINQLRSNIGNMYVFEVTSGGNALKFYASVRLDVRKIGKILDGENQIGNKTRVKVVKNKMSPPFKIAEFDIMFGQGIDYVGEIVDAASDKNIVQKSGSWYSYGESKLGQGKIQVRQIFKDNPDLLKEIEGKIRENSK
jgi:recombination protein RecA